MASIHRIVLAISFGAAGAASLVHEVTWLQVLSRALSGSGRVLAPVLAGFLAGLAVGAQLAGRSLAGRRPDPRALLRRTALLEATAATFAVLTPRVLRALASVSLESLPESTAALLRLCACTLWILVATLPLGATFPFQVLLLRDTRTSTERSAGLVLALQTAGGTLGVLLCGFVALPVLGVDRTQWSAAALGGLVAVVLATCSRTVPSVAERPAEAIPATPDPSPERTELGASPVRSFRLLFLALATLSGFCSLAFEVVQSRILAFFLPDLAGSFSAVLATYLVSLALGAATTAWCSDWLERRRGVPALLAALAAAALLGSALSVDRLYDWVHGSESLTGGFPDLHSFLWVAARTSLASLGPGAFLLGMVLPTCVGQLARSSGDAVAAARAYSFNSLGSALGALVAGLSFVGWFGLRGSLVAIAALLALGAVTGVVLEWRDRRRLDGVALATLLALGVGGVLMAVARPARPVVLDSKVFRSVRAQAAERQLVAVDEGDVASVAVVEDGADRFLVTDSFQAAGTGASYQYMRLLGHLPCVLAERAADVVVVAFGTGTTAGALSLHPDVERLCLVELCPAVYEFAPYFESVNHGLPGRVPGGLELRPRVDDGRAFLRRTRDRFDVITLEPLLPSSPAAVHFYTREFFALARSRLAPGGVLCHWIPVHAQPIEHLQAMLAAFAQEFEFGELYAFGSALVLLGREGEAGGSLPRVRDGFAIPAVREDLDEVGVKDERDLLAAYLCCTATLRRVLADVPAATDDRPRISFPHLRPNHESLRDEVEAFRWLMAEEDEGPRLDAATPEERRGIQIARKVRRELLAQRLDALERRYQALDAEMRRTGRP